MGGFFLSLAPLHRRALRRGAAGEPLRRRGARGKAVQVDIKLTPPRVETTWLVNFLKVTVLSSHWGLSNVFKCSTFIITRRFGGSNFINHNNMLRFEAVCVHKCGNFNQKKNVVDDDTVHT